jgi:hypothetical protein
MTDFRMPDSWYEPRDEIEPREECDDDCAWRDPDHPGSCVTVEELKADEAEAREEARRDAWLDEREDFRP